MTDTLDHVPWFRTGPDASHLWDWSRQELRDQLEPGMILETHDCGYIVVHSVEADGVVEVRRSATGERSEPRLWSWDSLSRYECMIYRHETRGE